MVLSREKILYARDDKGELIPTEAELIIDENDVFQKEYGGETIIIKPLMRGELKKLYADVGEGDDGVDKDAELIVKHCINPAITAEEVKDLKPLATAIVNTILFESGVDVTKGKSRKKAVEKKEDDFSKNLKESNLSEKKEI